jgi:hypothetical protein
MRAVVVFESMFGNTKAIAEAVADALSTVLPVELVEVGTASEVVPRDVALLVVGGPTHAFGMSRPDTRRTAVRQAGRDPTMSTTETDANGARRVRAGADGATAAAARGAPCTGWAPSAHWCTTSGTPTASGRCCRFRDRFRGRFRGTSGPFQRTGTDSIRRAATRAADGGSHR